MQEWKIFQIPEWPWFSPSLSLSRSKHRFWLCLSPPPFISCLCFIPRFGSLVLYHAVNIAKTQKFHFYIHFINLETDCQNPNFLIRYQKITKQPSLHPGLISFIIIPEVPFNEQSSDDFDIFGRSIFRSFGCISKKGLCINKNNPEGHCQGNCPLKITLEMFIYCDHYFLTPVFS